MFVTNSFRLLILLTPLAISNWSIAERPLPSLHDGDVVSGPGTFRHDGELFVQGKVTLRQMTLALHGPIRVAAGAVLEFDDVHLLVSDPEGAPNGTSGLRCEGPAQIVVRRSTMAPVGSAHPMWQLQGNVDVEGFDTSNSEFHLNRVQARLNQFRIFELEISHESRVVAHDLNLVFLSTQSSDDDHLRFANIPVDRSFTQSLQLGSGAFAELNDTRIQFFLLYLHGHSDASLAHMDRVQLAIFPDCSGKLFLTKGRMGSARAPIVFPNSAHSDCPFHIALNDVNVDTWDVYAAGHARLVLEDSQIDELVASDHAEIDVRDSDLYADWLEISDGASIHVENSTVGALRLASRRADLATSQIRVSGHGRASFSRIRFDCGIVAGDEAAVTISNAVTKPTYMRHSGHSMIEMSDNDARR